MLRRSRVSLRLSILGMLCGVLLAACAGEPTSPTAPTLTEPPAVNLTGVWQGQYLEVGCQSTTCPVCCTSRGKTERRRDVQLVITQDGAAVTGLWTESPLATQGTLGGSVSGTVSGTAVALSGVLLTSPAPFPTDAEPWRLVDFMAQTSSPEAPLAGSFSLVSVDASGRETMRLRNDIVTLARRP